MISAKNLLLITSFCSVGTMTHGPSEPPISLSIRPAQETTKRGSDVTINVTLTNPTNHAVSFTDRNSACDYAVDVHDSAGLPAPQTEYKRTLNCGTKLADGRNIIVTLKPGESRQEQLIITRVCDLGRPGKYSVRVLRTFPNEIGDGTAASNTTEIRVTE